MGAGLDQAAVTTDATPGLRTDEVSPDIADRPVPIVAGVAGGQVVAHLPFRRRRYLGSPSVARLGEGYVISHDVFGQDSGTDETYVYTSADGAHWTQVAALAELFWPTLFAHRESLYLMGTSTEYGDVIIRRSDDGGRSWTVAHDERTGRLRTDAKYHTAPVPVLEHDGRLWRACERRMIDGMEWGHFAAVMMSAPADADLLRAESWTSTDAAEGPEHVRSHGVRTWLEGNAVVAPDGEVVNLLRTDCWTGPGQFAALVAMEPGGGRLIEDRARLVPMPGGGSKFTVRRDGVGRYWTLVDTAILDAAPRLGLRARNTLSLASSADLERWEVHDVVLHHPDDERHGFQYVDWLFDGDDAEDIVFACRTAHAFDGSAAHNYHDANLITFHRLTGFRNRGARISPCI